MHEGFTSLLTQLGTVDAQLCAYQARFVRELMSASQISSISLIFIYSTIHRRIRTERRWHQQVLSKRCSMKCDQLSRTTKAEEARLQRRKIWKPTSISWYSAHCQTHHCQILLVREIGELPFLKTRHPPDVIVVLPRGWIHGWTFFCLRLRRTHLFTSLLDHYSFVAAARLKPSWKKAKTKRWLLRWRRCFFFSCCVTPRYMHARAF